MRQTRGEDTEYSAVHLEGATGRIITKGESNSTYRIGELNSCGLVPPLAAVGRLDVERLRAAVVGAHGANVALLERPVLGVAVRLEARSETHARAHDGTTTDLTSAWELGVEGWKGEGMGRGMEESGRRDDMSMRKI